MSSSDQDVTIVLPEQTNGWEAQIPDHLRDAIADYQHENPDADLAGWCEVVAYCMVRSLAAPPTPKLVAAYTKAAEEYAGDLPGGFMDRSDLVAGMGMDADEAATELRREIAEARP